MVIWPYQNKFPNSISPAWSLLNSWLDEPESKESVQESVQGIRRIRRSKESKGIEPKHPTVQWPVTAIQSVTIFCYDFCLMFRGSAWAVASHSCGQPAMGTFQNMNFKTSRLTGWRSLYLDKLISWVGGCFLIRKECLHKLSWMASYTVWWNLLLLLLDYFAFLCLVPA